jgi:flavin-dependent dehydrogenase
MDHDVAIVGASLAGCTAAVLLAREGVRVALLERSPKPEHFKRVCTHYIQAPAAATLERLGLGEAILEAGGIRDSGDFWTSSGWVRPDWDALPRGYDLCREKLDPMLRRLAAETPGVELMSGQAATGLLRDPAGRPAGVVTAAGEVPARVVVGADGRDSTVARLAGMRGRVRPHGRFAYYAYFEGVEPPAHDPHRARLWFSDPDCAYAFPGGDGRTLIAVMPHKDRLPEFKADLDAAVAAHFDGLADAPDLRAATRVSPWIGRLDMTNVRRPAAAPGVALVGDAAQASDPLWGVGCGFALTSAEWLADELAGALVANGDVDAALARYRRRHRRQIGGHHWLMSDYATGRPFTPFERMLYRGGARDPFVATALGRFGARERPVRQTLTPRVVARAAWAAARA